MILGENQDIVAEGPERQVGEGDARPAQLHDLAACNVRYIGMRIARQSSRVSPGARPVAASSPAAYNARVELETPIFAKGL